VTAYIGLGSNLGDREALLRGAARGLAALPLTRLTALSGFIETEPVGPAGQGAYLNAAAAVETALGVGELMTGLLAIEQSLGRRRDRAVRWGPRLIDLDLLMFGHAVVDAPGLTVPHPLMHERVFVLGPLSRIAAEVVHPVLGRSIGELERGVRGSMVGG